MSKGHKNLNITKVVENGIDYDIGLDIGTGSVGWAVVSEHGVLLKRLGKNAWGSRLFESAETAADTRSKRTLRRRYDRRKQRIYNLRELIAADVAQVDPHFFAKFNQTPLIEADRGLSDRHILFNDIDYQQLFLVDPEHNIHEKKYPTIYHLRKRLVEDPCKEDIRLVYLALHHLVKYRGNFLIEGDLTAENANALQALEAFKEALIPFCEALEISFDETLFDVAALNQVFTDGSKTRRERQEAVNEFLLPCFEKESKDRVKNLSLAMFGYQTTWDKIFPFESETAQKFSLDKEDKVTAFVDEVLPEDFADVFTALEGLYNAYLLAGILKGSQGGTLSSSMVGLYQQHKTDLHMLRNIVKKYSTIEEETGRRIEFNNMFRGPRYADGMYVKNAAKGYTGYMMNKVSQEDFYKEVKNLLSGFTLTSEEAKWWEEAQKRIDDLTFLRKLRNRDNGAIPHQLHLEEMRAILKNQGQYYPTLAQNASYIEQILSFRIPYFVGPLGKEKNPQREKAFGWAKRRPGFESTEIKPWNIEEVVDFDQAAEDFITNLTGECTYYYGKSVIPKASLLYSEFCVRQELNKCKVAADGEKETLMDIETIEGIYQNVFKRYSKVKVDTVREYLKSTGFINTGFKGTQKEGEFASSMKSYCDFRRILGRDFDSYEDYEMVEQLILWVTVFENKKILKRKINQTYGPEGLQVLTADQVNKISKLRYTGWSNLSREFLTELKVDYNGRKLSIMGALRGGTGRPLNLMEVLKKDYLGFDELLEEVNAEYLKAHKGFMLDEIPGSPAIKRGINQALGIVDEIIKLAGKPPRRIVVEMAREEVGQGKGKRTNSRLKQLEELYKNLQNDILLQDSKELKGELKEYGDRLDDDRLFLYFLQRGKCMYCGESLKVENLSSYDIDHIVPQSMIKDDSLNNRVLVHSECNRHKADIYPLPADLRSKNASRWKLLKEGGLVTTKKYNNLMQINDTRQLNAMAKGFINRQLVETRQITKHVVTLLQSLHEDTTVETVKAELTHRLREAYDLPKVREVNDWHHAHDAYLACQVSRFIHERFTGMAEDLDYDSFSRYAYVVKGAQQSNSGLVVGSFGRARLGEYEDAWNGPAEVERIQQALNFKDCFVSKKLERLKGEFWNQTVYSPRTHSDKALPLKQGKDPDTYGYYMSPNSAYYALVEYSDTSKKKPKTKREMVGVPIDISYRIDNGHDLLTLQAYVEAIFGGEVQILRAPIYKYQKIEWNGGFYYLVSNSEMINARQLWLPHVYVDYLALAQAALSPAARYADKRDFEEWPEKDELSEEIFNYLSEQINNYYPRYGGLYDKLTSEKAVSAFESKSPEDKCKALIEILNMLHCNARTGLASLGLSGGAGRMNMLNLSDPTIVFIDTSITGMYESSASYEA